MYVESRYYTLRRDNIPPIARRNACSYALARVYSLRSTPQRLRAVSVIVNLVGIPGIEANDGLLEDDSGMLPLQNLSQICQGRKNVNSMVLND